MSDVSKLPKWAQRHIATLEMRVEEADRRHREALALIEIQPKKYGNTVVPSKKTLYFDADCDGISVTHDKGVLEIRAGWGGSLSVRPVVSNVIKVVTER